MKPKIYIDTSVIGGCFDNEFEEWSNKLISEILSGNKIVLISDLTVDEIQDAPQNVQDKLNELMKSEFKELITSNNESVELAEFYIHEGVITRKYFEDALHIALATINKATVMSSWNFKHIVNLDRIRLYNAVNIKKGYYLLEIRSPRDIIKPDEYD
ncbi:hypothetical protein ES708_18825 [subsurface metagenome]